MTRMIVAVARDATIDIEGLLEGTVAHPHHRPAA